MIIPPYIHSNAKNLDERSRRTYTLRSAVETDKHYSIPGQQQSYSETLSVRWKINKNWCSRGSVFTFSGRIELFSVARFFGSSRSTGTRVFELLNFFDLFRFFTNVVSPTWYSGEVIIWKGWKDLWCGFRGWNDLKGKTVSFLVSFLNKLTN